MEPCNLVFRTGMTTTNATSTTDEVFPIWYLIRIISPPNQRTEILPGTLGLGPGHDLVVHKRLLNFQFSLHQRRYGVLAKLEKLGRLQKGLSVGLNALPESELWVKHNDFYDLFTLAEHRRGSSARRARFGRRSRR